MKRILCMLMLAIFLPCCALAESQLVLVSPTPSAQPVPVGVEFSCEAFFVTLPAGMEILSDAQMEGYTAAVQAAFPDFTEKSIGFKRFSDVLKALEKDGLLVVEMDEQKTMLIKVV